MTEHHWFYVREGRREGPVRRARLLELVRGGWLAPEDLVWTEGMPEWVPAGTVDWPEALPPHATTEPSDVRASE